MSRPSEAQPETPEELQARREARLRELQAQAQARKAALGPARQQALAALSQRTPTDEELCTPADVARQLGWHQSDHEEPEYDPDRLPAWAIAQGMRRPGKMFRVPAGVERPAYIIEDPSKHGDSQWFDRDGNPILVVNTARGARGGDDDGETSQQRPRAEGEAEGPAADPQAEARKVGGE